MSPTKQKINLEFIDNHTISEILGDRDELIKLIERKYNVEVFVLGNDIEITGKTRNVKEVAKLIRELTLQVNLGQDINKEKVSDSINIMENKSDLKPHQIFSEGIMVNSGKKIKPRTEGQKKYIEAIKSNTIVFGIGPAGTGKTYLALAAAVEALKEN
ncbi:MAG: PhoH family protein, partial [Candidatus Humimicrobiaceae bacterium]